MVEFVCRRTGRTYEVGEQLDRDGHAAVHAVGPEGSGLVLKRYLPGTLQKRPDLEARIKAMIAHPPAHPDRSGPASCAWPEDAAYVSGQFVGFVMPRVDTAEAITIHDAATRRSTTWRERVTIAENLARAVAVLHDRDVVVGDFREQNMLTWNDQRVTLLGCDRMQVVDPGTGRRFPCVAARDACTPPELLLASLSSTLRTSSSDIFPLALHLHLLLLDGAHPFRGRWTGRGDSPPEHLLAQDGLWSYAGDPRLRPFPDSPPLTVLPETLRQYFRAAFVDGARHPPARPAAREWLVELVRLRESLAAAAAPDHRDDPVGQGRPVPPAPSGPGTPSRTRRLEPAAAPPPRRRLRLAAWAAAAVVVIGGVAAVVGAGTAAPRAAPVSADPVATGVSSSTSARPPAPRPDDPTDALEQMRSQDAPAVEALTGSWVAQLSTRTAGTRSADAAVLAGHDALRRRHPGAVLLWSEDWNYDGRSWITVVNEGFASAEEANGWCDSQRFAKQDCFAKRLSHPGDVEGSTVYRG